MQTLTGKEYLMAEIACKHDKSMEKKTWNERLAHFTSIDFTNPKTFKKASDPIGLRAALIAYDDTNLGKESGYLISLDACSSGLQILSLLVSCPKSFDLCGGVQDQCVDSYTTIYDSMNLHGSLTRKQVKAAIMTAFYGSTAMPEFTFGENIDLFYDTISVMAPGAWDLNLGLQELWDEVSGSTYQWTLPDNFHACIETKDKELVPFKFLDNEYNLPVKIDARPDFHKGLGPNTIHSVDGFVVREMFRRCMFSSFTTDRVLEAISTGGSVVSGKSSRIVTQLWDNYLQTGFLSVRILSYLYKDTIDLVDGTIILELIHSLPNKPFNLLSVHDCFRCHPNYGNDLRKQYNTIMADINDSNMLEVMAKQVAHSKIKTKKVGRISRDLIVNANYLLA
jgi:hypothetical protein